MQFAVMVLILVAQAGQLQKLAQQATYEAHLASAREVVTSLRAENKPLIDLLQEPSTPFQAKVAILDAFAIESRALTQDEIQVLLESWFAAVRSARVGTTRSIENSVLASKAVEATAALKGPLSDELASALGDVVTYAGVSQDARRIAIESLRNAKDPAIASRAVRVWIENSPSHDGHFPFGGLSLLTSDDKDRLYSRCISSLSTGDLHFGLLSALSDLGEQRLLPHLAPVEHPRATVRMLLGYYRWQLETQQSTEDMLKALASPEPFAHSGRIWLMKRLLDRGVERELVTASLKKHLASVTNRTVIRVEGREAPYGPHLREIIETAHVLGLGDFERE